MLDLNVAQFLQKVATAFLKIKSDVFQSSPKSHQIFGLLNEQNLQPGIFKIRPIRSHWLDTTTTTKSVQINHDKGDDMYEMQIIRAHFDKYFSFT